ncbi:MAG: serine/threonine-protein kinase [Candidatus Binatia bacterium]
MRELVPGEAIDQYRIEEVIARGGSATIFRARDTDSGSTVALKVPHARFDADPVFQDRFEREDEIGSRLDHPAVIRVLRPRRKSRVYIAMELVDGELLRDRLCRENPLPILVAVDVAARIADALVYLHQQGVVHRDLKPDNVMLVPGGGVKLMDFGIALDLRRGSTWEGRSHGIGTPDYMPPERIRGQRGDGRSDLYSLGCMLYEMLTGEVPFTAENAYAAIRAKTESAARSPRRLRAETSPALEEVVLSLLERNPAERPESALEVREKLAHPESVILDDRAKQVEPRLGPRARLSAGLIGMAALFGAFWILAAWLGR